MSKPYPGHKFARINRIFESVCECGWRSSGHIGKGGMGQAHVEFAWHIVACKKAAGDPNPYSTVRTAQ